MLHLQVVERNSVGGMLPGAQTGVDPVWSWVEGTHSVRLDWDKGTLEGPELVPQAVVSYHVCNRNSFTESLG